MADTHKDRGVYQPAIDRKEIPESVCDDPDGPVASIRISNMLYREDLNSLYEESKTILAKEGVKFMWLRVLVGADEDDDESIYYFIENIGDITTALQKFACFCIERPNDLIMRFGPKVELITKTSYEVRVVKKAKIDKGDE